MHWLNFLKENVAFLGGFFKLNDKKTTVTQAKAARVFQDFVEDF